MQLGPLEIYLLLALSAVCCAVLFGKKGRNMPAGFFVGLILGPIGVAIALILSPQRR